MNIDKQALREAAEKAQAARARLESFPDEDVVLFEDDDIKSDVSACNKFFVLATPATMLELLDEDIQLQREKDAIEAVALALRDDMRQSREKLEAAERRIAETDQRNAELTARIEPMDRRIAELEHSETQLINERDSAESALADMYQAATGERPEWSNMFGFADAVDVVEERLATLEANQSQTTPTGIQLITEAIGAHGYIVGCLLQGRPDLALEESRKWVSAFGQAAEIVSAQDADDIKVKGE
ncbi:ead/Ea22-like family protein [Salmonella enterica subsp. enterica serovar Newport]|nr:ead/Ea22-like family protein [Salmonella enterica subsp. enterica serovar Newport]